MLYNNRKVTQLLHFEVDMDSETVDCNRVEAYLLSDDMVFMSSSSCAFFLNTVFCFFMVLVYVPLISGANCCLNGQHNCKVEISAAIQSKWQN